MLEHHTAGAAGDGQLRQKVRRDAGQILLRQEACCQQRVVELVGVTRIRSSLVADARDRVWIQRAEVVRSP